MIQSRLAGIDQTPFDAVVIGGGMAGAGIARDLALRGVSVALFEKGDFASGTSSKSSKLIHGGLRYLELGDFKLVRESLRERKTLERVAPHLVRPLPFLVPVFSGSRRGLILVRLGMWLYDLLTPGKATERYRVLRAVDTLAMEPNIRAEDLKGAGYYFDDLLLFPERMCLENIAVGGAPRRARPQLLPGRGDREGPARASTACGCATSSPIRCSAVRASVVVNAAGPWADRVRELAGVTRDTPRVVRTTKGIHCLLPAAHRARRLPLLRLRRADDLRDPVARLLPGGHHRHRLRRRSRPALGHARGGRVPPRARCAACCRTRG